MPRVYAHLRSIAAALLCCLGAVFCALPAHAASPPKWARVNSAHFSVLTNAGQDKGGEAVLRIEQMRAFFGQMLMKAKVNLPEPVDVIGFRTRAEYAQAAPLHDGQPIATSGFFLPGKDRNYIVLDLSDDQSWRVVSLQFATLLLKYNYPPTQPWFDTGFAEYFSSLRLNDAQVRIGGDPAGFAAMLSAQPWLPLPKLFTHSDSASEMSAELFRAESWIVMHYLINQDKLSETGTYLGLVALRGLPLEQAIQQAYGVSSAQLEQAVKDYFRTAAPQLAQDAPNQPGSANSAGPIHQFAAPVTPLDIGTSLVDVPEPEARALRAEMTLRLPEHREESVKELQALINEPKGESVIEHRALAWDHMQRREYTQAADELSQAIDLNKNDPWTRYYSALVKYEAAHTGGSPLQGLPNMMQDLRAVIDWYPEFAEAFNMLAVAQLEGGGVHAAEETMHKAIQLNPRDQSYLLNLAQIYLAGKKWDAATELLNRLKDSPNPELAKAARQNLEDLPTLKKYGILPQREADSKTPGQVADQDKPISSDAESASADDKAADAEPELDRRKVQYLRAKLLSIDCSQSPVAVLKIVAGAKTMKLRTDNYKSLLLVGADQFSCDWKSLPIVVNYKPGGKADGDLVSVEIH